MDRTSTFSEVWSILIGRWNLLLETVPGLYKPNFKTILIILMHSTIHFGLFFVRGKHRVDTRMQELRKSRLNLTWHFSVLLLQFLFSSLGKNWLLGRTIDAWCFITHCFQDKQFHAIQNRIKVTVIKHFLPF